MKRRFLLAVCICYWCYSFAQTETMLIVVPQQFSTCLDDFITYKTREDISCCLVVVQDSLSCEEIKGSIYQAYQSTFATYLLLIGDNMFIPSYPLDEGWTDADYAIFGSDSLPSMAVGRFSCECREELFTMLEKSMSPHHGRYFGVIASNIVSEMTGKEDYVRLREMYPPLFAHGFQLQGELFDGSQGGYDSVGSPVKLQVQNLLNKGCDLLFYAGHGDYDTWQTSGFSSADIAQTRNTIFPIIFSAACLNGNFVDRTCFAESWLGSRHGAKAVVMSSALNDWDANLEGLGVALASLQTDSKLGDLWLSAFGYTSLRLHRNKDAKTWVLFGDPSMSIMDKNNTIVASNDIKDITIYPNPTSNIIHITTDTEVSNPKDISIYDQQGRFLKSYHLSGNHFQIDLSEFPNGIYFFTIANRCMIVIKH